MRTLPELLERVRHYRDLRYLHKPHVGYVVWRVGTGDNLEIVFVRAAEPGHGYGKRMLREMVAAVTSVGPRPYHSVYAYRLRSNEQAGRFYRALGFREVDLGASVYRDDGTVLAWVPWAELVKNVRSERAETD